MEVEVVVSTLGTLAGLVVGSYATYKIQERRLRHTDATQFQEKRIEIYAQFLDSANTAIAQLVKNIDASAHQRRFLLCFETVRLIASEPVRDAANAVHFAFGKISNASTPHAMEELIDQSFHLAVAKFVGETRKELRV
ncbi:MAG: hypothetical protein AAF662_01450 [Pseudomonadota bacterium]